jgi:sterol desaturase/sphingolipid hydroxylase (fatty acid hydroxylase superfamily)
MPFSIEHSTTAYRADFVLHGAAVLGLGAWLALRVPAGMGLEITAWVVAGILVWSPVEYALHRFVLHGLQPFKRWHTEHHRRPAALICAPTLLSASLIGLLVWLPAVTGLGQWHGSAITLGVLIGYLGYAITHHALHHSALNRGWLQDRKYWHARHHHLLQPCCFGVTSGFWDRVLRTGGHRDHARTRIPVRRMG